MTPAAHTVTWEGSDFHGRPTPVFQCHDRTPTAPCRLFCDECLDITRAGDDVCDMGHPLTWHAMCDVCVWLDNDETAVDYAEGIYRDGPIDVEWHHTFYAWRYQA